MGVFAARGAGKTFFVTELLLNQNELVRMPFKKVIWICKTYQNEVFERLMQKNSFEVEFLDDIPDFDHMTKEENKLIVIDDFQSEASKNDQVCALFTRGRHLNISIIYLSQNLFHQGKNSRDMALNIEYLVLLRNPRDASQINHLNRQMYPRNKDFLPEVYHDAVNTEKYAHLLLDLKPYTNQAMRVRAKVFDPFCVVYVPKL